jgi:hypothetical protein
VKIREPEAGEPLCHRAEQRTGVAVAHAVERPAWRESNPDPIRTPDLGQRLDDLDEKTHSILDRTAVLVGPLVGVVLQKLIHQVAVGRHQFDTIETRLLRVLGGRAVLFENTGDLRRLQRAMRRCLTKPVRRIDDDARISPVSRIDRRGDRLRSRDRDVRRTAGVPKLGEEVCALGVNYIRDAFPGRHMVVGVETGRMVVTSRGRRDRCRFRDDQPAVGGSLRVIFALQVARNARPWLRP